MLPSRIYFRSDNLIAVIYICMGLFHKVLKIVYCNRKQMCSALDVVSKYIRVIEDRVGRFVIDVWDSSFKIIR